VAGHAGQRRVSVKEVIDAAVDQRNASFVLGDVITTFRLLLRFALVRGEIDESLLVESERSLDEALHRRAKIRPSLLVVTT
jgi:hypothetical protein